MSFSTSGAIHKGRGSGKSPGEDPQSFFRIGVRMRGLVILFVILVVVVGGAILLSRSVEDQPTKTIEVEVTPNAAPR